MIGCDVTKSTFNMVKKNTGTKIDLFNLIFYSVHYKKI